MGPSNERIDVNASAAVRSANGFFFGTLRWIHGDRLLVEVDGAIEDGEVVDIRITLAPSPGTALVRAKMQRNLVTAQGETPRFVFAVEHVAPEEQALLEKWLGNAGAKGTFSSFDAVSASAPLHGGMSGASRAERRAALERMSRTSGAPERSDNFGLSSDSGGQSPRAAMRDALRRAIAAPPVERLGLSRGATGPPDPGSVEPTSPPFVARPAAPSEPPPLSGGPPAPRAPGSAPPLHATGQQVGDPQVGGPQVGGPRAVQPSLTPSRPPATARLGDMPPMAHAARSVSPGVRPHGPAAIGGASIGLASAGPFPGGQVPPGPGAFPGGHGPRAGLPPLPQRPRSIPPADVDIAAPARRSPTSAAPPALPGGHAAPTLAGGGPPVFDPIAADPSYATIATRSGAWLEVRWTEPAIFANDVAALLLDPVLTLPNLGDPLPDVSPLRLMLRHHDVLLDCAGDVEEYGPFGASYHVRLELLHRRTLEVWLEGYRRK